VKSLLQASDSLRKFAFADLPVRGELVHLERVWREVSDKDDYPAEIRSVLGEALAASVLLASCLKFEGLLTLQLTGDGPMGMLVVQCSHRREVRGLAKWRGDVAGSGFGDLAGSGRMAITIESGEERRRYQGIVPIVGDSLAQSLEAYFRQSVQVPTRIWLTSGPAGVAGMLLQRLPEARDTAADAAWEHVQALADTLAADELADLGDEQILRRLFSEEDLRVYEADTVDFRCSCSQERVETTLRTLGRAEIEKLLTEMGRIEVRCEFCNDSYRFDADDAESLFQEARSFEPPPTMH
jgi:molecular chaperone Hsp33